MWGCNVFACSETLSDDPSGVMFLAPDRRKSAPLTTIEVVSRGVRKVRKAAVRANRGRRSVTTKPVTAGHPSCDLASRKRAFMPS